MRWRGTRDPAWLERAADALAIAGEKILDPEDISLTVQRGLLHQERGDYHRARETLQQALFWDPTDFSALRGLARVYTQLGMREEAEQTYLRALSQQPNNWSLRNRLGKFYYDNGFYKKAEDIFTQLIEITPNNPLGYSNLAAVYHIFERNDEALGLLDKALAISPGSPSIYANKGSILFYRKRYEEAATNFEKYVALRQNKHSSWGNLADAYRWAGGRDQQAKEAYRKAISLARDQMKVNPNQPELRIHIGYYHAKLGEIPEALLQLEELPTITDPSLLYYMGIVYELAGRRDQAINHLRQALERGYGRQMVQNDPELDDLRKDARFADILATGNLQ
jgi:tetratricopeptide (TPR) repeat protein